MTRSVKQSPPADTVGVEISPEWYMKARALLTHLWLDQNSIPHGEIDVWHRDHPEDVHTYRFQSVAG